MTTLEAICALSTITGMAATAGVSVASYRQVIRQFWESPAGLGEFEQNLRKQRNSVAGFVMFYAGFLGREIVYRIINNKP